MHDEVKKSKNVPSMSVSTLYSVIYSMGIRAKQHHQIEHAMLLEDNFLINWRTTYIKRIRDYRRKGYTIFFQDESYFHQHDTPRTKWVDTTILSAKHALSEGLTTGSKTPFNPKGRRIIMLAMGSDFGFFNCSGDCEICTKTWVYDKDSIDYHDSMVGFYHKHKVEINYFNLISNQMAQNRTLAIFV